MSQLAIHNPNPLTPYAPRVQGDYYPTDPAVIRAGVGFLDATEYHEILEPGAGNNAPFLQVLGEMFTSANLMGVEERSVDTPKHLLNRPYAAWLSDTHFIRDFWYVPYGGFDLVATNPPFGDRWEQDEKRKNKEHWALEQEKAKLDPSYKPIRRKMPPRPDNEPKADAEAFLRKIMTILKPGGVYMGLMRTGFWSGKERFVGYKENGVFIPGVFTEIRPYLMTTIVPRPSFNEDHTGTDGTEYAFYFFEKGYNPKRPESDACIWR